MNIFGFLLVLASFFSDFQLTVGDDDEHFLNDWAAEIVGGIDVARDVAEQHGYRLVRSLESIPNYYLLERSDTPHRSRRSADHHTQKLADDERVVFVEQQQHKTRVKRGVVTRDVSPDIVAKDGELDDPQYPNEWYINQADTRSTRRDSLRADLKVRDVWKMGITGEGVVITVIDDGLEINHSDLKDNYDKKASYDFNDNDDDPSPRYDPTNENKHGTRCAGEIAMVANNTICGVGIAHKSRIGGIRILDGSVTDRIEAQSLSHNKDYIDIYSSSWGPNDDGKTCEGPGRMTKKALEDGVKQGRKGLGSIFIWACGNGGRNGDNCNADGYTSAIETISICSASQDGTIPYYSERCASTMTATYSSGSSSEGKVVSADLHNKCTDSHSGTSAAAPMAAGIVALLLQVNPYLTWRDVQQIIAHTSRRGPLTLEKGWYRNGAGYCVNLAFGFGLMDALEMVTLANRTTWKNVGPQKICRVEPAPYSGFPREFISGQTVEVEFTTDGCEGQENEVNFLEHVQVTVDIAHEMRGHIYAELESPSGTITSLMLEREGDRSKAGLKNWNLTSTHTWGERSRGTWRLRVADRSSDNLKGVLKKATLILYGTKEQPEHQKNITSQCDDLGRYADIDRNSGFGRTMHGLNGGLKMPALSNMLQSIKGKTSAQIKPPATGIKTSSAFEAFLNSLSQG